MGFRERLETAFATFGKHIICYRWLVVFMMVLLTIGLGSGVGRLVLDTSPTSYISTTDPARLTYNKYRALFENDDIYLIVVRSDDIYSKEFLHRLDQLHKDIEMQMPYLDVVDSLVNARVVRGEEDDLIVDDLLDPLPETPEQLAWVKQRIQETPAYVNSMVGEDENAVVILVNVIPDGEEVELEVDATLEGDDYSYPPARGVSEKLLTDTMKVMVELQEKYNRDDFQVHLTGDLQMTFGMMRVLVAESQMFIAITMVVIGIALFLLFRRVSGVLLPILVIMLPIIATIGFMGWVGLPMTMSTGNLPTFLFAVCVGDAVHVLSVFYQRLRAGDEKEQAIIYTLSHSGLAILMTSVTTAGALTSFVFSNLMPIQGLGIAAPVGVMLAFVYSVVLLPALLAILPIKALPSERGQPDDNSTLSSFLVRIGRFCTSNPWTVISVWAVLVGVSIYGASQVKLSHDPMRWFPEDAPTRVAAETANEELKGVISFELMIDSGKSQGLLEPGVLQQIDELEQYLKNLKTDHVQIGHTMSVIQILKETNQALHGNDPAYYSIPDSRELIAQELLLFEVSGSDDLERVVDPDYRIARVHASVPFENAINYIPFMEKFEKGAAEILDEELKLESSGIIWLYIRSFSLMLTTTIQSYGLALLFIAPLMVLLIGEFRLGAVSLIPNLAPIVLGLGAMYFLKVPLDMFTMKIGTIAIGIAVDDTIHFMHVYRRYYRNGDKAEVAVEKTLHTTGKALLITSIALCAGFFVQMGGEMVSVSNAGLITGITIIAALLADITLSPALVVVTARYTEKSTEKRAALAKA